MMWPTAGARCGCHGCHDLSSSEQCNLLSGLTIRPTLLADDNGIPDIRPDIVGPCIAGLKVKIALNLREDLGYYWITPL